MDVQQAPHRLRSLPSWLLGQVSIEARRVVGQVLAEEEVHRSQYALMASLDEFGPLSQTELSERSGLDRSDLVRWVDGMVATKLVKRSQDPRDRRRNVISLTGRGRQRLGHLDARLGEAQNELLKELSVADRKRLVVLLGRVLGLDGRP